MKKYTVAVVGATGLVGSEMILTLHQRKFPVDKWRLFATHRSAGMKIQVGDELVTVEDIEKMDFAGIEIALFAGGEIASKKYAQKFIDVGAVVIDNSATYRMDPEVPLVTPEVNPHHLVKGKRLIANPNCSTIQMVVALKPIYDAVGIERIVTSTYQSVSGTGKAALNEMKSQARLILDGRREEIKPDVYPHQIGFNVLPHIGSFKGNGYTSEELKALNETRKMFDDNEIRITSTTVRVCTEVGHAAAINIETKKKTTPGQIRDILRKAPGVTLVDDPASNAYPHAVMAAGKDDVYVGRIRQDLSHENCIEMFITADNLRKGAALNAVQIAEVMMEKDLI